MIVFGTANYTAPVTDFGQRAGMLTLRYRLLPEGTHIMRSIDVPHTPMTETARRTAIMRAYGCLLLR